MIDTKNPSSIYAQTTKHRRGYELRIFRGDKAIYIHKHLLPWDQAWDLGCKKLIEFRERYRI